MMHYQEIPSILVIALSFIENGHARPEALQNLPLKLQRPGEIMINYEE